MCKIVMCDLGGSRYIGFRERFGDFNGILLIGVDNVSMSLVTLLFRQVTLIRHTMGVLHFSQPSSHGTHCGGKHGLTGHIKFEGKD